MIETDPENTAPAQISCRHTPSDMIDMIDTYFVAVSL